MNALTQTTGNAVAAQDDFDPFAAYGAAGGQRIVGKLLKFSKGDYLVGQNGDQMEEGSTLAVNMHELLTGWIKWKDKKPSEQIMGLLKDRFAPPQRDELGDLDEDAWEVDANGDKQDPWQFTNYLLMKVPGMDDQDALFTFTTSSRGGINAVRKLCTDYAKQSRMWAKGEMPIVKLLVEKYKHDKYGWLKNPMFKIISKVPANEFAVAMEQEAAQTEADAAAREAADKDIPF